jgi:hypothetical protein
MKNLNPYNEENFRSKFELTDTYKKLKNNYHVWFTKFSEIHYETISSPRQQLALSYTSAVPWYYLNYLDSKVEMFDLGCGYNFFKPYFPVLTGIGAENNKDQFFGDIHDFVDDQFYHNHLNTYDSVFSINALHFHPLENLQDICIKFSNMLRPGGRGFLALNVQRMTERSTVFRDWPTKELDQWIRDQFVNFSTKILVFDVDLTVKNAWLDGNIRIVFEK